MINTIPETMVYLSHSLLAAQNGMTKTASLLLHSAHYTHIFNISWHYFLYRNINNAMVTNAAASGC
jgi:hypothetical protein